MKYKHPYIYAIDFDNTIVKTNNYPNFSEPIQETVNFIKALQKKDNWIWILNTCRTGNDLEEALKWLEEHQLYPDYVNENTPYRIAMFKDDSRKISATFYLEDKVYGGLKVPPISFLNEYNEDEYK